MKKNRFIQQLYLVLLAFILLIPGSISIHAAEEGSTPVSVDVSPSELTIQVGGSQKFFASAYDQKGNGLWSEPITWTSSDEAVVTVDTEGVITAITPGVATITATTSNQVQGSATVTVESSSNESITVRLRVEGQTETIIPTTSVTLSDTTATDNNGKTHNFGMFTPYAALVKILNEKSIDYDGPAKASIYVSRIADESANFLTNEGWNYNILRNNSLDPSVAMIGMGQYPLQDGDEIIVYYGSSTLTPLSLSLDNTKILPGQTVTATVTNLASGEPAEGSIVHFGNETAMTNSDGKATYTFNLSGDKIIYAEKEGSVRTVTKQVTIGTVSEADINEATRKTVSYYRSQGAPEDWAAFALNALNEDVNQDPYIDNDGSKYIDTALRTTRNAMTDWARGILGLLSAGYDPSNINGVNYYERMMNNQIGLDQGQNAAIYGLIALDAAGSPDISGTKYTKEDLINHLLTNKAGKGWNLMKIGPDAQPDPDITAMAIISLAPYMDRQEVNSAVDEAVTSLKEMQTADGGFGLNSQSISQVIQALTSIGKDPQGVEFTKPNGSNPVSALLQYQLTAGGFKNISSGPTDDLATEQAASALASLKQYYENRISKIYQNVTYVGNSAPEIPTNLFDLTTTALDRTGGIKATVKVTPANGGHSGNEVVIFQLMKGSTPDSIVAIEKDITTAEQVTAHFNKVGNTYTVKVFVVDSFGGNPANLGISLADPVVLQ